MKLMLTALLAAASAFAQPAPRATFYVAPDGDDASTGTLQHPFRSLARARDAVRGIKQDVVVMLRGGIYRLSAPVVFSSRDSGDASRSITYTAYPGEQPVLSGGQPIHGWKKIRNRRWEASTAGLPYFRQLFVDGVRRTRARSPNSGYFRVAQVFGKDRTQFQFKEGEVANCKNLADVELVFLHDWEISRMPVAKVDEEKKRIVFAHPVGNLDFEFAAFNGFEPHQRYYLENALEFLDNQGEWYLDRSTGLLTYQSMIAEAVDQADVVAPVAPALIVVRGTAQSPVRNLRFRGLRFEHTDFALPPEGYAGIQAGHYAVTGDNYKLLPAAIEFEWAVGCRLENCRLRHLGASGVGLLQGCQRNVLSGNEISDVGGNGIQIGQPVGAVTQAAALPNPPNPAILVKDNQVSNNYVHHAGQDYFGSVGIWVGFAQGTLVAHNLIHDLPYTGISVGWDWGTRSTSCRDNRVEFNHIHHVMRLLSDGGGIYTLGWQPGTVLRGNHIHDVDRLNGRADQNGIFFDEGSQGYLVQENLIYRTFGGLSVRFNQTSQASHNFRDNTFNIEPGHPSFPARIAAQAGLEPTYRMQLLGW